MKRPGCWMPSYVRQQAGIGSAEREIWSLLIALAKAKGHAYCTVEWLALVFSMSVRTVQRKIGNLRRLGVLRVESGGKARPNRYFPATDCNAELPDLPDNPAAPRWASAAAERPCTPDNLTPPAGEGGVRVAGVGHATATDRGDKLGARVVHGCHGSRKERKKTTTGPADAGPAAAALLVGQGLPEDVAERLAAVGLDRVREVVAGADARAVRGDLANRAGYVRAALEGGWTPSAATATAGAAQAAEAAKRHADAESQRARAERAAWAATADAERRERDELLATLTPDELAAHVGAVLPTLPAFTRRHALERDPLSLKTVRVAIAHRVRGERARADAVGAPS